MAVIYCMDIAKVDQTCVDMVREHFPQRYEKSQRYRFPEDQARCIGGGVLLHEVAGLKESQILYNEYGKPYVEGGPCFSLSHSGSYVVLALDEVPIGVDIEAADRDYLDIAPQVFTEQEIRYVDNKKERFFEIWTLKEALAKAIGEGLHMKMKEVEVLPFLQEQPVRWQEIDWYGYTQEYQQGQYVLSLVTRSQKRPEVFEYLHIVGE